MRFAKRFGSPLAALVIVGLGGSPALAAETVGKIVSLEGRVLTRNADSKSPVLSIAKVGDTIERGSVINTSSTSSAKLLLNDKTIVDVGPSTLFKVDDFLMKPNGERDVGVSMDYGKIRTSVTKPLIGKGGFKVKTRTATMGVRGTEFVVQAGLPASAQDSATEDAKASGPTQITVLHGKVEVATPSFGAGAGQNAAPVALTAGGQLTTSSLSADGKLSEAPKVVTLPASELASVKSDAKQPDRTFNNAVVVDTSADGTSRGSQTLASFTQSVAIDSGAIAIGAPIGIPGTFAPDAGIQVPVNQQNFGSARVSVRFNK